MPSTDILLRLLLEDKLSGEVDKAFDELEGRIKHASSLKELDVLERQFKDITKAVKDTAREATLQARALRNMAGEVSDVLDEVPKLQRNLLRTGAGHLQGFSTQALVAGLAIPTGIFAEVNRYVSSLEEGTEATKAWKEETDKLANARKRVDEVLVREALPALKLAANLANQASAFVESHPEIVSSALKVGVILAGVGVLGSLASKGIRLYTDIKYLATIPAQLAAAELQDKAAAVQLQAALLKSGGISEAILPGKKIGGSLLGLGPLSGLLAGAGTFAAIGTKASQVGAGLFGTTPMKFWEDLAAKVGIALPKVKDLTDKISNFGGAVDDASTQASDAIVRLAGSANEGAIVAAFSKWKEDDAQLVTEAAENRKKIYLNAEKSITAAARQHAQQTRSINAQAAKAEEAIIRDFANDSKQKELDYARSRANIIKDAGREVEQIEEQHQENIREMTLESNQRREELTSDRDALGLAKEVASFDRAQAEAERETNLEIAKRRQDTAIRLQELADSFAFERAQRQAQFIQALNDNEARKQEELKAAAAAYAEEVRVAREQRATQIRELQQNLNAERLRRREAFIGEIRDLDTALLGERNLKSRHYAAILAEAERMFADMRSRITSLTTAPGRAYGGYASYGLYRLGDTATGGPGGAEYVMSSATTRAAEQVIGGQLSQRAILNAMLSGTRGQIVLNDHRRFDSRLSLSDRRTIQEDTMQVLGQVLK